MSISIQGGSSLPILPDSQHANFQPQISPDGRHLAFGSFRLRPFERRLSIAAFANNSVGRIENSLPINLVSALTWSPDGKSFTYISGEGIPSLCKFPVDGTSPQPITD